MVIDIPVDVTKEEMEYDPDVLPAMHLPGYKPNLKGHPKQIKEAARLIAAAERPVIYAGGGVIIAEASDELRELAFYGHIPVTTTLTGKGCFPEDHDLSMGMLGMHGTQYANYAISKADLIIAVGVRFDDRVTGNLATFAPEARFIHVDRGPGRDIQERGRGRAHRRRRQEGAGGAPGRGQEAGPFPRPSPALDGAGGGLEARSSPGGPGLRRRARSCPSAAIAKIWEVTRGEAIVCTEVGQHQMWAAQHYLSRYPRRFISSGGLGTMGFGFPAAIGAQVACPGSLVIDIAGDGSFQMTLQELATAVQYDLPVKVCIINNQYLGMVRQWQELFWNKRYSHTCIECQPDFVKLAEAYGAEGYRADRPGRPRGGAADRLRQRSACRHRHPGQAGRQRLSHDPGRRVGARHDGARAMKHTLSVLVENKPGS